MEVIEMTRFAVQRCIGNTIEVLGSYEAKEEMLAAKDFFVLRYAGKPGIVMISPVSATMKPAPADTLRFLTVTSKSDGAPTLVASSEKLYCVFATQTGILSNPRSVSCLACFAAAGVSTALFP